MDYEKLYKDALERAKKIDIDEAYASQGTIAKTIFPELAESDDEKARKFLIQHISEWIGCIEHDLKISSKDIESEKELAMFKAGLAYLEKQKDASKAIEAVDRIDRYIDGHVANAHDMKDSNPDKKYYRGWDDALGKMSGILQDVYSGEKQKEQEPAEKQDYSGLNDFERAIHRGFLAAGIENVPVTIIKETAKECLAQMKPAEWSEEDDWKRKELIQYLEEKGDYRTVWMTWLKSLPERFNLEPKEEWSDKDEKMLNSIINVVCGVGIQSNGGLRKKQVSWLKSLPERFNLQQKVEWSEEDKQDFDDLIMRFEKSLRINRCYFTPYDVDWLKSKFDGNSCK